MVSPALASVISYELNIVFCILFYYCTGNRLVYSCSIMLVSLKCCCVQLFQFSFILDTNFSKPKTQMSNMCNVCMHLHFYLMLAILCKDECLQQYKKPKCPCQIKRNRLTLGARVLSSLFFAIWHMCQQFCVCTFLCFAPFIQLHI